MAYGILICTENLNQGTNRRIIQSRRGTQWWVSPMFNFDLANKYIARLQQSLAPPREPTPPPAEPEHNPADETYRTQQEEEVVPQPPPKIQPKTKPKVVSVQLRKKREAFVDSVIESLPLEYRGSQPVSCNFNPSWFNLTGYERLSEVLCLVSCML